MSKIDFSQVITAKEKAESQRAEGARQAARDLISKLRAEIGGKNE